MIRVLLLVVVLALALAAGAWALFLHSADHGHRITVGVLEDAVKLPDPKLADERVAFASRAGFNALDITTKPTRVLACQLAVDLERLVEGGARLLQPVLILLQ